MLKTGLRNLFVFAGMICFAHMTVGDSPHRGVVGNDGKGYSVLPDCTGTYQGTLCVKAKGTDLECNKTADEIYIPDSENALRIESNAKACTGKQILTSQEGCVPQNNRPSADCK
jgi:hypothetical protein